MSVNNVDLVCLVPLILFLIIGAIVSLSLLVRAHGKNKMGLLLLGFGGWFVYQYLYTELVWDLPLEVLAILCSYASIPLSIVIVYGLIKLERTWIAYGIFMAMVCNGIALVYLSVAGYIDDMALGVYWIMFLPFFVRFIR